MADDQVIPNPYSFSGFDDAMRTAGQNGQPAAASHMVALANGLTAIHSNGRMLFAWWGRDDTTNDAHLIKTVWNHHHVIGRLLRGIALVVKPTGTRAAGQGVRLTVDATTHDYFVDYDLSGASARSEPGNLEPVTFGADLDVAAANRIGLDVGSLTANGPGLHSGLLFESARIVIDPTQIRGYIPTETIAQGRDIVTESFGSTLSKLDTMRTSFLHAFNRKRPQTGWSHTKPGTGTNYIELAISSQQFRYIFDQTVGDGGTAPAANGPAFTFPFFKAGSGLNTTIRCAVFVYAAMSGNADTGSIGVSHKDGAGGMTAIAALSSGPTITGTTFAWYPTLSNVSYFNARTDVQYERIVLCAKSSGATDKVRIGAFAIMPIYDDSTIT